MAISHSDRVSKALDLLNQGLSPFVQRELRAHYAEERLERTTVEQGTMFWG